MHKNKKHKKHTWLYAIAALVVGWLAVVVWFLFGCGTSSFVAETNKGNTGGTNKGGTTGKGGTGFGSGTGTGTGGTGSGGTGSGGTGSAVGGGGGGSQLPVYFDGIQSDLESIKEQLKIKGDNADCGCSGQYCECK